MANSPSTKSKGFPTYQLFILSLCRICEPISFTSIFSYIYQMIRWFGTAKNESEIAIYAGAVTSVFALAEFSTGVLWGKISDTYGRKPVLIMGLVGTLLSNAMFGFATNFPVALIARVIGGGLNGNVGVIQTTVAELVTEREHQPRAFAIMPFVWCLGSIVGPSMGGLLAEPTKYYPGIFPPGGLFEKFPYLLPNIVASIVLVVGITVGILFLEETHGVLRHQRDPGREAGKKLVSFIKALCGRGSSENKYEGPDGYVSPPCEETETDPFLKNNSSQQEGYGTAPPVEDHHATPKPPATTKAFTRPVVMLIISYGLLAFHTMGFDQMIPVFLSTPRSEEPPSHIIKFTGGLGMGTQTIGGILSVQGLFSMLMQFFLFPPVVRYFGNLNVYRFCLWAYMIPAILIPYLDFLPQRLQMAGIYFILAIKVTYGVLAYPCNAILLTNSAPSLLVLGAINGVAASCASLARGISPTLTGMSYSYGMDHGVVGLAFWINAVLCFFTALQTLLLRNKDFEGHNHDAEVEELDEEAIQHIAIEAQLAHSTEVMGTGEEFINEYSVVKNVVEEEIVSLPTGGSSDTDASFTHASDHER